MTTRTRYPAAQIKSNELDLWEVFGYVQSDSLPFRLIGFSGTEDAGILEAAVYCAETLQECERARACGWCDVVLGIYAKDEREWRLIPGSWEWTRIGIGELGV